MAKDKAALRKAGTAALFTRASGSYDAIIPLFAHFGRRIVDLAGVAEHCRAAHHGCGAPRV